MRGRRAVKVVVGSSNLTQEGLSSSGELGLAVAFQADSAPTSLICASFDGQWKLAKSLQERQIGLYEKRYRAAHKQKSVAGLPTLREILGRNEGGTARHSPSASGRPIVSYDDGKTWSPLPADEKPGPAEVYVGWDRVADRP
jgi:hypothetical protein